MKRREVLQKFLLGGTVLVLAPSVMESCSKDPALDPAVKPGTTPAGSTLEIDLSLPENAALNSAGGSKTVGKTIIINTGTNIVALTTVCTHQGCTVAYNSGANDLECPCHGSVFSTSGSVVNGPASSPLSSYSISRTGNILTITF